MHIRLSAKAIIFHEDKILLVRNGGRDGAWYSLPGGGQHFGETLEEAVRRECAEEVQLDVRVGSLRYVREYLGRNHEFAETDSDSHQVEFWFECEVVGVLADINAMPDANQIGYDWIGIKKIAEIPVFPKVIRRLGLGDVGFSGTCYLGDVN